MMLANGLPLVSIITPSYNSADYIEMAIASVLAQDYPNIEHIVIDGGSTDPTLKILKKYDHKLNWVSEPDEGQADALNKGFQQAKGDFIGWLNADDTYQAGAVSAAINFLQAHPTVSLVYGGFNFIDENGDVIQTHYPPPFSLEKLLYSNIIPNAGMFFRRQIIIKSGGVRPELHYTLDWEFVLRMAQRYQVAQVPAIWGNFRITTGTKSVEKSDHFWPEIIPILQKSTSGPDNQLQAYQADALFWAYLLGAVEFARTDQVAAAKTYLAQAFNKKSPTTDETADFVFPIVETATRPWHQAFREYPEARQTIARFTACLGDSPVEQALRAYLNLYQNLEQLKAQNWRQGWHFLAESWPSLPKRGLLRPKALQSLLYLFLGTTGISRLRTIKGRLARKMTSLTLRATTFDPGNG